VALDFFVEPQRKVERLKGAHSGWAHQLPAIGPHWCREWALAQLLGNAPLVFPHNLQGGKALSMNQKYFKNCHSSRSLTKIRAQRTVHNTQKWKATTTTTEDKIWWQEHFDFRFGDSFGLERQRMQNATYINDRSFR